ncbi:MAG TPA: hypothetical protein VKR83_08615, partial [Ktedonobacteraceae bacterium]|nr:hypothetical protein [Ktedonobacteraceae bacterium]
GIAEQKTTHETTSWISDFRESTFSLWQMSSFLLLCGIKQPQTSPNILQTIRVLKKGDANDRGWWTETQLSTLQMTTDSVNVQ